MDFHGYLNVEGVPGESTDLEHKDWITIQGFFHTVSMKVEMCDNGTKQAKKSDHGQFKVEKMIDVTTPTLSLYCSKGYFIRNVKVNICRNIAKKSVPCMQYEMKDVFITKVSQQGRADGKGENMPFEEVTFDYGKIVWIYTQTDQETGARKNVVETNWNTIKNIQD